MEEERAEENLSLSVSSPFLLLASVYEAREEKKKASVSSDEYEGEYLETNIWSVGSRFSATDFTRLAKF